MTNETTHLQARVKVLEEVQALVDAARDARLQIAYIDERSPSGTSQSTLARLSTALGAIKEGK